MHRVLVLANGQQTRFGPKDEPKQLVPIDGEPLLAGTIRRLAPQVDEVRVVTWNPVIQSAFFDRYIDIGKTSGLQETMAKSREWWTDRTTYIFGDCYYTDDALAIIAGCDKPYTQICRTHHSEITGKPYGETFAMSWDASQSEKVFDALQQNPTGTSWQFYRKMAGIEEVPEDVNYLELSPDCLIRIDDWTDDFDCREDYDKWLERRASL
jgi:hypothetical protein